MEIVQMHGEQAATTSHIIAEGTEVQHASVIRLVRDNLADFEEFGGVGFEIQPFETAGGTQSRNIAVLNREHAMLLMTYMRNTAIVRDFKKRLIKAFIELENRVAAASALALPRDYATALRELAASVEAKELAEKQAQQAQLEADRAAKKIAVQAPMVAKAQAHSGVERAIGRQEFARQVQQFGASQGVDIKQKDVFTLLARRGMTISGKRSDHGQITSQARRAGWGWNKIGVSEDGYEFTRPQILKKGQDVAWKWVHDAFEEFGERLNPQDKETA